MTRREGESGFRCDRRIAVDRDGQRLVTSGLAAVNGAELSLVCSGEEWMPLAATELLEWIADYIVSEGKVISHDQTMAFGYGMLHFKQAPDGTLEVWEATDTRSDPVRGAFQLIKISREQRGICQSSGLKYQPVRASEMAAIGSGVLEGQPVEGMRSFRNGSMTGWWLVTESTAADYSDVRPICLEHLVDVRPELLAFLALPSGSRFDQARGNLAWFDPELLDDVSDDGTEGGGP